MKVKTQSKKVNKAWLNDHVNDTYVKLALNTDPTLNLVVLWFRDVSGLLVEPLQQQYPTRVVTGQVPMRSSPLCLECSL
jgi:hypothetical protein